MEFPDLSGAGGPARLPASDDVLAKWMALTSDEDRVIRRANMHLVGRQLDPVRVRRDLWRLAEWERRRQRRGELPSRHAVNRDLRSRSRVILDGPDRAQARAYLKGVGFDDDALQRPIVGIANTWTETMPCNFHLRRLAEKVKEGVREAGGTPMEFNTVAISDGITMGTEGMQASLVSREVIADSIELVARGHMFDAVIALSGCDKTIPGCVMALARLDVPSLMLYGGSIAPGRWRGKDVTIQDVFEGIGAHAAGDLTDDELTDLENHASPGAGRLRRPVHRQHDGHGLRGARHLARWAARWCPPRTARRAQVAAECGRLVIDVLERDLRPSQIITRDSLENAIAARRHVRRLHQPGAAPARRGPRGGRAAGARGLRPDRLEHAAAGRPEAGRPLRGHRPLPRRRRAARDQAAEGGGPAPRGRR